jgi:HEPN domain-containing protein
VNRDEFRELARIRLIEAKVLLDSGHYDGAYYLCGYAVECALKASIARKTSRHDFPPKPNLVRDMYTHNVRDLVFQAGLRETLADMVLPVGTSSNTGAP